MSVRPLIALVSFLAGVAGAEEPFAFVKDDDGVRYERRNVPESKFYEYRATFAVPQPPRAALESIWQSVGDALPPNVGQRTFLRRSDTELLVYDRINTPIVSDREVTLLIERRFDPPAVRFQSRNDLGPPTDGKRVRLPLVRGTWALRPHRVAGAVGTELTFVCYSDPGGDVPAFMVRSALQEQLEHDVHRVLARLPR